MRYRPSIGGLESAVENLACTLKSKNFDVNIITRRSKAVHLPEDSAGIPVSRLMPDIYSQLNASWLNNLIIAFKLAANIKTLFKLNNRIFSKFRPQIVNICFPVSSDIYVCLLSLIYKIPIIVSLHGEISLVVPFASAVEKLLFKFLLKKADYVIACSENQLAEAVKMVPSIADKSKCIYNGILPDYFLSCQEHPEDMRDGSYILTIANLWKYKGVDILLMAMRTVYDCGYNVKLVIVGEGNDKEQLMAMSKSLKIENKVIFKGSINDAQEKKDLLRNCEFLVLPSRLEPFGIVNLEAMAAGKAVVSTRCGGTPEVVKDGINGILVEPHNDQALAQGMMRLLDDQELTGELGRNGRKIAQEAKFSWDNIADQYIEIYKKVLLKR